MRVVTAIGMAWALAGCGRLKELLDPPEPNCDPRGAFYPDADGDGVGDVGAVYIGCEAPEGYVAIPPPLDTDTASDTPVDTPADTPVDTPADPLGDTSP